MNLVAERNALAHSSQLSDEVQFAGSDVRIKLYNTGVGCRRPTVF